MAIKSQKQPRPQAKNVHYDNTVSGLEAKTVQKAIDEIAQGGAGGGTLVSVDGLDVAALAIVSDGGGNVESIGGLNVAGGGGGVLRYETTFAATRSLTVTHNLGYKYVLVQIIDNNGDEIFGEVIYTDVNNCEIDFSENVAGTVIVRI